MAETESDINRDEQERNNLLGAISSLETAIAVSNPGTRRVLENALENSKQRVTTLDAKIEVAKVEHATEVQMQVAAAAALAAKETKLNGRERETYRGFLDEAYFTKKDFGKLDQFYAHSYDRLSEDGKDQMSQRIDEGIKRGEFKFSDLPTNALEKEANHRAGKVTKETPTQEHSKTADNVKRPIKAAEETTARDIDFGSVDLTGIKLADAASTPNPASIPDASGASVKTR